MEKIERTHPDGTREFILLGDSGGVSFITGVNVIGLHYPVAAGDSRPKGKCDVLPAGECHDNLTYLHGETLARRFKKSGENAAVVYDELQDWYDDHLS